MPNGKKTKPLLYIYQPFARTPFNQMQDIYRNKIEKPLVQEETEPSEVISPVLPSNEISLLSTELSKDLTTELEQEAEPKEEVQLVKEQLQETKPSNELKYTSFTKVKSFKEMNLKERLEYLANFPKAIPPVPCVFYTKYNNYQGYLLDYQVDSVTIKFYDQTKMTIPLEDLREILMIGIRK